MRAALGEKLTPAEATLAPTSVGSAEGHGAVPVPVADASVSLIRECPFLAESSTAMRKMMNNMAVKPTGEVDQDFVAMMIPQHQGAIDMARSELRYGHDVQVRRIAQEIIVDQVAHLALAATANVSGTAPTSVSLFDQGLIQVVEAAVSGLQPKTSYILALAENPDGSGPLQPLQSFMTNPAGAAIVNAIGPIRQLVETDAKAQRRYLVIAPLNGTQSRDSGSGAGPMTS